MPKLVQVMIGRLFDAAYEAGQQEGYRKGVDAVALKQEEIYQRMYEEGAQDANQMGSALFTAAVCCVLHDDHKFGRTEDGLQRVLFWTSHGGETAQV